MGGIAKQGERFEEIAQDIEKTAANMDRPFGEVLNMLFDALAYIGKCAKENGTGFMEALRVFIDHPDQMETLIDQVKETHQ